jgi:alkylation response protein AidB-like acyl-CoA dehydrogenase
MNFDLTEEQALLKATVERFGAEHHGGDLEKRRRQRAKPGGFDRANWGALAELGVTALPFSEADCGLGGGSIEIVSTAEAMGAALATEPFTECLVPAAALLGRAGGVARGPAVAAVVGGTALPAMAILETAGRYNLAHVECRAKEAGGAWRLTGAKTAVWQGMAADLLMVSARVSGEPRDRDGIALFLVDASAEGVSRRGWRAADGQLAAEIGLHDAPAVRLDGVGVAALEDAVAASWLAASAEMVGTAQLLFDTTLAYVKTRVQFGKPLGSFQVIQHRLAEAYVLLEQSRSLVFRAALAPEAERARMAAGAKAFVADAARRIAHEAVQLHGGMGVTDELLVGHGLKRIQLLSRLFGDPEQAATHYARAA